MKMSTGVNGSTSTAEFNTDSPTQHQDTTTTTITTKGKGTGNDWYLLQRCLHEKLLTSSALLKLR